jgi:hypothetical protein
MTCCRGLRVGQGVGFTAAEALRAVTSMAADACRVGDRKGRIARGYDADLLAVAGDPLTDANAVREVVAVFRAGHGFANKRHPPLTPELLQSAGRITCSRHYPCAVITDETSPLALRSTRNRLRIAMHRRCTRLSLRTAGRWCRRPGHRPPGPCQRFAKNCATRSLLLPHNPAPRSASDLRDCTGT